MNWKLIIPLSIIITSIFFVNSSSNANNQITPDVIQTSIIDVNVIIDSTFNDYTTIVNTVASFNGYSQWVGRSNTYGDFYNQINVSISQLSTGDHDNFVSYLNSINVSDRINGNAFNATAFNSGIRNESFYGIQGHSYNASESLDWISNNLWDQRTDRYTFYIFNLTELNSDLMEHWFSIFPKDMDTNKFDPGFFSSASSLTYGREVMGWGGENQLPIQFLDLSATGWYADFINTAWGGYGWNTTAIDKNLSDWVGQYSSTAYVDWLTNILEPNFTNLFVEYNWAVSVFDNPDFIYRTVDIENVVFINWTYNTLDEITWILQDQKIEDLFENAFPWIDFQVNTRWLNLSDDPDLETRMQSELVYDPELDLSVIEVSTGFLSYLSTTIIPKYFPTNSSVIQLPSLTFLNDPNTTMTYGGVRFAGLGGMGWQLQSVSPERLLDQDGNPREGLSSILSHEIGHSLGLPHPFYYGQWSSDFTSSIMGYYPEVSNFSEFDINKMSRTMSKYYTEWLRDAISNETNSTRYMLASIKLEEAETKMKVWNFTDAISDIFDGVDILLGIEPTTTTIPTTQANSSTSTITSSTTSTTSSISTTTTITTTITSSTSSSDLTTTSSLASDTSSASNITTESSNPVSLSIWFTTLPLITISVISYFNRRNNSK